MSTKTANKVKGHFADVQTRLMKKNYEQVPQWWFLFILFSMGGLAFWACLGFGGQLQLPWWGILLSFAIAFVFTLPIGIIQATSNMVSNTPFYETLQIHNKKCRLNNCFAFLFYIYFFLTNFFISI